MKIFLSCDWGTSVFRLRSINYLNLDILAEEKNDHGIAGTFAAWQSQRADPNQRLGFYQSVITASIQLLSDKLNCNLSGVPVIISGMAASNIGMIELPYKEVPVALDGSDFEVRNLKTEDGQNPLIVISGIRTSNDVMRGEETKIVGCSSWLTDSDSETLIVLPGTHPKHATVKNQHVINFKTYMTGEFFSLLTKHSVLASSVKSDANLNEIEIQSSFKQGVEDSFEGDVLSTAFKVRTNDILKNMTKGNNFNYLSGLLIGSELRDLLIYRQPIYLCGSSNLIIYYKTAFDILGIKITAQIDADIALLNGQKRIYSNYF